jgi:hypothetical protein
MTDRLTLTQALESSGMPSDAAERLATKIYDAIPEEADFELEFYKLHRAHEVALNNATATYEQSILRLVLVLNAASIGALLTLMNTSKDSLIIYDVGGAKRAIYWWAAGILFAFVATAAGYWSQRAFTQAYFNRRRAVETRKAKAKSEGGASDISALQASLKNLGIDFSQQQAGQQQAGNAPDPRKAVSDGFVEKANKKRSGAQKWQNGSIITGGLAVIMAIIGFWYAVHAVHKRPAPQERPAVTQNSMPTSPMIEQPQKPPLPPLKPR